MVRAAALALLLAGAPWDAFSAGEDTVPDGADWVFYGKAGDVLYVVSDEMERDSVPPGLTVWIHGYHRGNAKVNYRRSLWKAHYDCHGSVSLYAYTTYDADGTPLSNWDGYSKSSIRPGTADASLAEKFCT